MRSAIRFGYRCAALVRRLYWFVVRPRVRGVKCLIEHEGRWLLIKNSYGDDRWTLPGGACRRSETPEQAARREVVEEVGITLGEIRCLGSFFTDREYKRDTVYCFHAQVPSSDHRIDGTEVEESAWFEPHTLPDNRSRTIASLLRLLAATT